MSYVVSQWVQSINLSSNRDIVRTQFDRLQQKGLTNERPIVELKGPP